MSRLSRPGIEQRPRVTRKEHTVVLEAGPGSSFVFDAEGRLLDAVMDGVIYRRGMDNRLLRIAGDHRDILQATDGIERLKEAYEVVRGVATRLGPRSREALAPALACDADRLRADAGRYKEIYGSVPILPPDLSTSIYLQATLGCPTNRCSFCLFYHDRPFRIRSIEEFTRHVADVRTLLGPDAERRRTLFLGDSNALVVPTDALGRMLVEASAAFPGREAAVFADAATHRGKSVEDVKLLRSLGLRRATIGLETGHAPLYSQLRKPGTLEDATATIRLLKEGGLSLGISLLVGLGGQAFEQGHLRDSAARLLSLPLGRGDHVYLSPLSSDVDSDYAKWALQDPDRFPTEADLRRQLILFRHRLEEPLKNVGVRVAVYDVSRFVYG